MKTNSFFSISLSVLFWVAYLNLAIPCKTFGSTRNANSTVDVPAGVDAVKVENKINVLRVHTVPYNIPDFSKFVYSFKKLLPSEFEVRKPVDALPFDAGFVDTDGTVYISDPTTENQKQFFQNLDQVALYYLCQSYMYYFYQSRDLPLLFKVGFPAYEAGLNISDATVKAAIEKYGGKFNSFDELNNSTTFIANNGIAVAHAFGEMINVYKNWGYPQVKMGKNTFDVESYWGNTGSLSELLADFNRYLQSRFLEADENLRVKLILETDNFRIYSRQSDANINFPQLPDALEAAYKEYTTNYNVKAYGKLTAFTLSGCADANIEGISCDPSSSHIGGTAWSSGLHFGCGSDKQIAADAIALSRHELAHAFQGFMPAGETTQWLMEGFAFFSDAGPMRSDFSDPTFGQGYWKQTGISSLAKGTNFFGHRPTYEDTKVYPGYETDYGYKYLGYFFDDFIYRKGGYLAVKEVELNDLNGYKKMGYSSGQAFLDDFYFDFDVRVQDKPVVTLKTPITNTELTTSQVNISWTPLKADVKYNILVSTDNKANWTEIVNKTTQTAAIWNSGNYNGKFFLKFVAPENMNLESVFGPFTVTDVTSLCLNFPNGGEYLIAEDTVKVSWGTTSIPNIKLEYSDNNGSSWKQVSSSVATAPSIYKWIVPNVASSQCKVRITDVSNASKTDGSDKVFTILKSNLVGGPYLYDKNTMLLMHFDNDLDNRSYYSGPGIGTVDNLVADPDMVISQGNCLKTTSPVTVKHTPALSLSGDWTIEAWVKINSFTSDRNMYMVTKPGDSNAYESNYSLELNPWWGNVFHGFFFSASNSRIGQVSQSMPVTLNQWYHVAFIRDTKNAEIRLIVRDKDLKKLFEAGQKYTQTTSYVNTRDLLIGVDMDGYIDELRISNVARTYIVTAITGLENRDALMVYPNPTDGLLHLDWGNIMPGQIELKVFNAQGQVVYVTRGEQAGPTTMDLSHLPKGIYLIWINGNDGQLTRKLILK